MIIDNYGNYELATVLLYLSILDYNLQLQLQQIK